MKYDIIIIGSGPAGYAAAVRAARAGRSVAVVERDETGGTCVNWGCIPTKALLKSAQVYNYCAHAAAYGIELAGEAKPDMTKIIARSRSVAEMMNKGVQMLLKKSNIELIKGSGRIVGRGRVAVGEAEYEADNIVIATGARPREMAFMPIDHCHIISSKDALALDRLPESIIIVGSGAIGCEFAQFYASLGAKVTIVEYMPQIMPLEDEEVAKAMERSFRKQRVGVLTATTVKAVRVADGKCEVEIEGKKGAETLTAEVVLSAVGIKSNIDDIGLEEVGVKVERDKIVVDSNYQTTAEGIYAIGDVIATPALAHVASAEAVRCIDHICGREVQPIDYSTIPSCIFTVPEVASVGLTEKQATEKGIACTIGRYQFAASGKAAATGERDGFVKLIFDEQKRLIGAHLVGANVTEMLGEPTLAKALGATARDIARAIHAHPTMNEGIMEAAEEALA